MRTCRVCGGGPVDPLGTVEYLSGYAWTVYRCGACGCRLTRHDPAVHDQLHRSGAIDYYRDYKSLAVESQRRFAARDVDGLRAYLAGWSKYRFVMDELEREPSDARVLEVGASRGYLTAYSILRGRDVLGVDVSAEAVEAARASFGDRFALVDSPALSSRGPWDVVYHVGMIGCVADPLGLTAKLLDLLRPGGRLLFNAPNLEACSLRGQLWLDSAPPPDLVTLFPPGFWRARFADVASVNERVELHDPDSSFRLALRRRIGPDWRPPGARARKRDRALGRLVRAASKVGRVAGLSNLARLRPTEFGLFVELTKPR